ncbi:hypothetical protein PC128_g24606 [Phytophthora cactorum]|nr:hypothetical protein PC128_g24606 [Phytophthora cactorum]
MKPYEDKVLRYYHVYLHGKGVYRFSELLAYCRSLEEFVLDKPNPHTQETWVERFIAYYSIDSHAPGDYSSRSRGDGDNAEIFSGDGDILDECNDITGGGCTNSSGGDNISGGEGTNSSGGENNISGSDGVISGADSASSSDGGTNSSVSCTSSSDGSTDCSVRGASCSVGGASSGGGTSSNVGGSSCSVGGVSCGNGSDNSAVSIRESDESRSDTEASEGSLFEDDVPVTKSKGPVNLTAAQRFIRKRYSKNESVLRWRK